MLSIRRAMLIGALILPLRILADGEFFVSPNGNDAAGDGSQANPFASIETAYSALGTNSGSILLMPGNYVLGDFTLHSRGAEPDLPTVDIRPQGARGSVKVVSNQPSDFFIRIATGKVAIRDLQFEVHARTAILVGENAHDIVISGCIFDMRASDFIENTGVDIGVNPGYSHIARLTLKDNTFIHPTLAAVSAHARLNIFHFQGNTIHLPTQTPALLFDTPEFRGALISNNIVNYAGFPAPFPVLAIKGKGVGTKVDLNCLSTSENPNEQNLYERLHTQTVAFSSLAFDGFDAGNGAAGASINGPCIDLYARKYLKVISR